MPKWHLTGKAPGRRLKPHLIQVYTSLFLEEIAEKDKGEDYKVSLEERYNQLKKEYETYQKLAEDTIQKQSMKIIELDKKLDMVSLIVEISEYINRCLGSSEIDYLINDIMIGILGVTYSSVYLMENRKLKLKASNLNNADHHYIVDEFNKGRIYKLNNSILNSYSNMCKDGRIQIHSSVYMPIYMKDRVLGLIVVEHNIYGYLSNSHVKLLTALTNQIAICLENNRLYNQIKESSQKDGLTGLFNRTYFFYTVNKIIEDEDSSFGIVMIDIDDFKICNDTKGHQCGDAVIRKISKVIKANLREEDICGRYGGEEIIVYMYGVKNIIDIYNRMESIRKIIAETVTCHKNIEFKATVSMGIAIKEEGESLEQIIRRADINLYKAKALGKNRVIY